MATRKALFKDVYRQVQEFLCALGMHKRNQGFFTRPVVEHVIGIASLNTATKYGFLINPIIAVRYQPLERLVATLADRKFDEWGVGTIAQPIGYLSPPYMFRQWKFEEGRDNAATVSEMVHEITTVGFRYMEENSTLEKMCERIAVDRHFIMGSDVYQLPVGYMMLGHFDDAEKIVRNELAKIAAYKKPTIEEHEAAQGEKLLPEVIADLEKTKDDPIPAHVNYREFAERFFKKLVVS